MTSFDVEFRTSVNNGECWQLSASGMTIFGKGQRPVRMVGTILDITERERSKGLLLDHTEKLRSIVDTVIDGIISINSKAEIASWNPAAKLIFGYESKHDSFVENYLRT
jgi:PAS domain-containing protein